MRILFLVPYPLEQAPSQRFRFEQYFHHLTQKGFTVSVKSFWDQKTWGILYKSSYKFQKIIGFMKGLARRMIILFRLSEIDLVFVHRECLPVGPPVIEWLMVKILKKKIIYDFDDAIWLPNTSIENKVASYFKYQQKVGSICKWSYRISCGNSFLAAYALQYNKDVVVNPTTIDTHFLHNSMLYSVQKQSASVVIGWTGTHSTLPYLISFLPIFNKLQENFSGKFRLLIIANKDPEIASEYIDFIPWSKQTEIEDLLKINIGIMPLNNDIWALGKCGFKALQYMALGIPTIASPVGVNVEIIDHSLNGYICDQESDWLQTLEMLIRDSELRKKIGLAGREKVISHYSVSSNSSNFMRLFS